MGVGKVSHEVLHPGSMYLCYSIILKGSFVYLYLAKLLSFTPDASLAGMKW
ncbi:hypothetical protein OP10G_2605 [Fimbriimonas ginsengisoli Gsoil 348]|uniref:Uncharacterized protein n=1 Tax=Fimbriimonas ginsengisoli Gsoil 348 TaxID=661478 RepID=A0A068NR05_FIMGI|nr:hypothetical protein OP10G_2605 [Fimbriimonas ginsengisoli Gsoil 348]